MEKVLVSNYEDFYWMQSQHCWGFLKSIFLPPPRNQFKLLRNQLNNKQINKTNSIWKVQVKFACEKNNQTIDWLY